MQAISCTVSTFPPSLCGHPFPISWRGLRAAAFPDAPPLHCRTYGHVRFTSCVNSFGDRVYKVATDSKIAHLYLAKSVDQHIGRFDV